MSSSGEILRLPDHMRGRRRDRKALRAMKVRLRGAGLHTVCEEARCPNQGECFRARTAAFMILGKVCTRACTFCAVAGGEPLPPDPLEPERVAETAAALGLGYVVVTSVTRDDLPDGGAGLFEKTIRALRRRISGVEVEVLTPDFLGKVEAVRAVAGAGPDVYNHNLETVPRLYPEARPQAVYARSLDLLRQVKIMSPGIITKSGLMVGLGERLEEVVSVMRDLRGVGCDILTIGQYLRPGKKHHPVARYYEEDEFDRLHETGSDLGFKRVYAGPFVRSSFHAAEVLAGAAGDISMRSEI